MAELSNQISNRQRLLLHPFFDRSIRPWLRVASPSLPGGWSGSAVRLTGCGLRASRRSATNTTQLSETLFVSPVTGYAHDEAGNLIYLSMVGHKTVLWAIRATIQARQLKKLFLQGRPVYPLASHYCQTWQHLSDYRAYHATLIDDAALPGKWQAGEEVVYLLVCEGELPDGSAPETWTRHLLTSRLSETLSIPILNEWEEHLWEIGQIEKLILGLVTDGDCQVGYTVQLDENGWKEVVIRLLKEHKISISRNG